MLENFDVMILSLWGTSSSSSSSRSWPTDWLTGRLLTGSSALQKGFLQDERCYKYFVLQEILTHAKRAKLNAKRSSRGWTYPMRLAQSRTWHDPQRAYKIRDAMRSHSNMGLHMQWLHKNANRWRSRHPSPYGRASVKIVCLIRLFLTLPSIRVTTKSNDGYALHGRFWSALAYADDIARRPRGWRGH